MSKSSFHSQLDDSDPVPSYEESIGSGAVACSRWTPATLHQQLDEARLFRVRDILSTYVNPLLEAQGAPGVHKTIFLLVPSNVHSLQDQPRDAEHSSSCPRPKEPVVVGFMSTDVVKLIYLKGEEHTAEFWRQPAVMEELATNLRMRLKMSGHRVEEDHLATEFPLLTKDSPAESVPSPHNNKKSSSRWFSSKSKKPRNSLWEITAPSEAIIVDRQLGWRSPHESTTANKVLSRGEMRVSVEWKEICLRVENAVGLYDTRKGPGICLSVEVGA